MSIFEFCENLLFHGKLLFSEGVWNVSLWCEFIDYWCSTEWVVVCGCFWLCLTLSCLSVTCSHDRGDIMWHKQRQVGWVVSLCKCAILSHACLTVSHTVSLSHGLRTQHCTSTSLSSWWFSYVSLCQCTRYWTCTVSACTTLHCHSAILLH